MDQSDSFSSSSSSSKNSSSSRHCSKTSTENQSTDFTKNDIDMDRNEITVETNMENNDLNAIDSGSKLFPTQATDSTVVTIWTKTDPAIKIHTESNVLTSETSNDLAIKKNSLETTNDLAINKGFNSSAEDTVIISTKTMNSSIQMNDFIDASHALDNNPSLNYDMNPNLLDAGNSSPTKPAAVSDNINNSLFFQESSTTNDFNSTGSTHGIGITIDDARNSTTTKPADSSGNTTPSDKTIDNCIFSSFELDLYILCLFLKDTVVNKSKKVLVSPHSNHRRVVFQNIIKSFNEISNNDSLLNINMLTCCLYSIQENKKGLQVQSLYDVMDNDGNTFLYIDSSKSAYSVVFSGSRMNNIEDVKAFFSHLRKYKLHDPQGLQDFTKDLNLDVSVDNASNYLEVRKAFQAKYGIYMAFLDGNHRIVIAALILGIIPVLSDSQSDTYLETYVSDINKFNLKIQQTFTTWIYMDYNNSLLSSDRMLNMSCQIKIMQDKSFGGVFSDIINICKAFYDSSKQIHHDIFNCLNEDNWLKVSWLKESATKKLKTNTKRCIVRELQAIIVPNYLRLISDHYFFKKDLQVITGENPTKVEEERNRMLGVALNQEFRPVTKTTYLHASQSAYPLTIKGNLHLLTVASYDPVILEMLYNLTSGNFNTQEQFPQRAVGKEFIKYDSLDFSMNLHKTISYLVEVLFEHLRYYLSKIYGKKWTDISPRFCKFKQMLFIHFLKEILPVFLKLGSNPKIPEKNKGWLNRQSNTTFITSSSGTGAPTILGKLLCCFLRIYYKRIKNMESSYFAEKYREVHENQTINSVNTGVILLKFEDIIIANEYGEGLPLQFDEFIQDFVYDRKSDLYRYVKLSPVKKIEIYKSNSTQEDSYESNTVATAGSTQVIEVDQSSQVEQSTEVAQELEDNQQENISTESKSSSKTNRKKRRTTSSKNSSKINPEAIFTAYNVGKKMKQDILDMQDMPNISEDISLKLAGLITDSEQITNFLIGSSGAIVIKAKDSTVQKGSSDIGTNSE